MTDRMLALTWMWGTPKARTPGAHEQLERDTAFLLRLEPRLQPIREARVAVALKQAA